jgi:hypothetical protein
MSRESVLNETIATLRASLSASERRVGELERAAQSLIDCPDFWRNAGTLPGEYDNLVDALSPAAEPPTRDSFNAAPTKEASHGEAFCGVEGCDPRCPVAARREGEQVSIASKVLSDEVFALRARIIVLEAALVERKDLHEQIERLRAEAGAYRVVLEEMVRWFWGVLPEDAITAFERVGEEFYAETGMMRPGKSYPLESYPPDDDVRRKTWDEWVKKKRDALEAKARAALSQPAATGEGAT